VHLGRRHFLVPSVLFVSLTAAFIVAARVFAVNQLRRVIVAILSFVSHTAIVFAAIVPLPDTDLLLGWLISLWKLHVTLYPLLEHLFLDVSDHYDHEHQRAHGGGTIHHPDYAVYLRAFPVTVLSASHSGRVSGDLTQGSSTRRGPGARSRFCAGVDQGIQKGKSQGGYSDSLGRSRLVTSMPNEWPEWRKRAP
jgi:hypothetical protein